MKSLLCGGLHDSHSCYNLGAHLAGTYYGTTSSWAEASGSGGPYTKEKRIGKPWTPQEDALLTQAIAFHGENDNWKAVAKFVPGRTNKACRKRWLHSLSPNVKKSAWTPEEDELLLKLLKEHGPKWSLIARQIQGRTDDACSKRYREALNPSLKKTEWTAEEDVLLYQALERHGPGTWKEVGAELNRASLSCRNRWRMLERRKVTAAQSGQPGPSALIPPHSAPMEEPPGPPPQWLTSIPDIRTEYWGTPDSQYPPQIMEQSSLSELTVHPTYLSSHFSSSPHSTHALESQYPSPSAPPQVLDGLTSEPATAPFQFSSSSLSLALTLPSTSPSSSYLRTPPASQPPNLSIPSTPIVESAPSAPSDASFMSNPQDFMTVSRSAPNEYNINTGLSPPPTDSPAPVHFNYIPQQASPGYECNASSSNSLSPRSAVQAYPTPMSSPLITTPPDEALPDASPTPPSSPAKDPHRHYRTPAEKAKSKIPHGRLSDTRSPRLSATLPVTSDPTVLAYACGHELCWPRDGTSSSHCYATSQELSEHWKAEHLDDTKCTTPFRCGLTDCGKHWKSINGLQYHLQLSKAHFQRALSTSIARRVAEPQEDGAKRKKLYRCPRPNCPNQYRQKSGLRYHLAHGHQEELPTQLNDVPPSLARKVALKMQEQSQDGENDDEVDK